MKRTHTLVSVYRVMLACVRVTFMSHGKDSVCDLWYYMVCTSAQRHGLLCEEEENSEDDEVCVVCVLVTFRYDYNYYYLLERQHTAGYIQER